jgi:hypothetical protein
MTTPGRWDSKNPMFTGPGALPGRALKALPVFNESERIGHRTLWSTSEAETTNAVEENTDLQLEFDNFRLLAKASNQPLDAGTC